ncbi:baseplate J/gp47 family protein [Clostridium sp. BJN0001]|uniref:baseplate J/gp47 family protein n=1 Tax=Clostridium sp. BJN0001 TaxID=2930219 RepID=UPI001FD2C3CC|nr:baseplate J/gp47 family protein [Clostridium sp. BJN0001]
MQSKEILNNMLDNTSDELNKSEGQFVYDVEAASAIELGKLYSKADEILNEGFVDTCDSRNLERKCSDIGIERKKAKFSTGIVKVTGNVGSIIYAGNLFATNSVNFKAIEDVTLTEKTADIKVECTEVGNVGNVSAGDIKFFPVTLSGIASVINEKAFSNGYDEETDAELRERYYLKVRTPATSGNKYSYMQWCLEVDGVGACDVIPLWNGNGTVKCIILNSNKTGADEPLINAVANHVEEVRPIGATVTVASATELIINLNIKPTYDSDVISSDVLKSSIKKVLTDYLKEIAFKKNYVSLAQLGAKILNIDGVTDYEDLTLNNVEDNVSIPSENVAVSGEVTLNE